MINDFILKSVAKSPPDKTKVDSCLILQYHRVASLTHDPLQLAVEPHRFESQMEYLAENFNVISMEHLRYHLETAMPFRQRTVVVTFDCGYSDVLYTAKEVLERYRIFATVFVPSANIVERTDFWWDTLQDCLIARPHTTTLELEIDGRLLKWSLASQLDRFRAFDELYLLLSNKTVCDRTAIISQLVQKLHPFAAEEADPHRPMDCTELIELDRSKFISIGGYTHNCVKLDLLPKWQQIEEITKNKNVLEELLAHDVKYLAYPYGDGYAATTVEVVHELGFSLACGGSYDMVRFTDLPNSYELPRVKAGNWNPFTFYRFLKGFFD
jgi:peptidoglycan/xylan/chitin deacetylase (PgdA/CDA1 family)